MNTPPPQSPIIPPVPIGELYPPLRVRTRPSVDGARPSLDNYRPSLDNYRPSLDKAGRPSLDNYRPSLDKGSTGRPSFQSRRLNSPSSIGLRSATPSTGTGLTRSASLSNMFQKAKAALNTVVAGRPKQHSASGLAKVSFSPTDDQIQNPHLDQE
ncbi:hypothetical protein HK100_000333 [Physocladia obscura]|uniref:Uncharacterized protein n=1 Tax=Physocladia obscura TaxID=109957 RepID=A0AAD5T0C0_9FUNG|nr:hypothetical protein HK100_000333 [Physocladia obscura]